MLTFAACVIFSLVLSSSVNAQLVFDRSTIDGNPVQPSVLDAGNLSYGLQPVAVTNDLASANGIEYNVAFSADPVELPGGNQTGLDVRSWDSALFYVSTLEDALSGTPTARYEFNPLESTAPNGQQFQDLIIQTQGANGETHYTFDPVANLGLSQEGNPHHQITLNIDMDAILTFQDESTTTLGSFLNANIGETLLGGSVIQNATSEGSYDIPGGSSLGQDGVVFGASGGFEVEAGFAHRITPISSVLLGDVNLDGEVTFADIPAFITVLSAGTFQDEADCDENGEVNFADIPAFIEILIGQ